MILLHLATLPEKWIFYFCLFIMETTPGSSVRQIDEQYYENVDGMLQPITVGTAQAIAYSFTVSEDVSQSSSRDGYVI